MSHFTEPLLVSPLPDGRTWVVVDDDFAYAVGGPDSHDVIHIPQGFTTDFASVPRLLWNILPPWGTYGNAAVLHDWLYWDQGCSRKDSDDIFLEAMGVLGTPKATRLVLWSAVRAFGWLAWHSNAADRAAGVRRITWLPGLRRWPQKSGQ